MCYYSTLGLFILSTFQVYITNAECSSSHTKSHLYDVTDIIRYDINI